MTNNIFISSYKYVHTNLSRMKILFIFTLILIDSRNCLPAYNILSTRSSKEPSEPEGQGRGGGQFPGNQDAILK